MTFGDCPRQMFSELFGLLVGVDQEWSSQGVMGEEVACLAYYTHGVYSDENNLGSLATESVREK